MAGWSNIGSSEGSWATLSKRMSRASSVESPESALSKVGYCGEGRMAGSWAPGGGIADHAPEGGRHAHHVRRSTVAGHGAASTRAIRDAAPLRLTTATRIPVAAVSAGGGWSDQSPVQLLGAPTGLVALPDRHNGPVDLFPNRDDDARREVRGSGLHGGQVEAGASVACIAARSAAWWRWASRSAVTNPGTNAA